MIKIKCFEDLDIWKEGLQISLKIYELLQSCKDFGFRDQIQRASVSEPSNIAKGSCGELRTQLYLAKGLQYISKNDFDVLLDKAKHLSAVIYKFIKTRKENF